MHEDPPRVELLRDGAKEASRLVTHLAIAQLLFSTLNPSPAQAQLNSIRPVEPLLRRYKNLLKTVLRDASLRARHAVDVSGILREIERWLAEALLRAGESVVAAVGDNSDEEPEPRDWDLNILCDALLVKRALKASIFERKPTPSALVPADNLDTTESVLAGHAHFPAVCTSHVITHLLSDNDEPEPEPDDTNAATAAEKTSYDVCLANWANDSSNGAAAAVADETERDDKVSSFNSHRLW
ncbi:hypothetical protein BGY98DRAFT_929858 [Russula aff. rugulosa BPL654]|nr:hypothetical protein BGY98DRAFT_929858 [Russula aff. rugulosa BPL654]